MQETLNSFLIRLMAFHKTGTGQPPLGNWPVWGHHFTAHGMTRIGTSRIHSGAKTQGLRFGDLRNFGSLGDFGDNVLAEAHENGSNLRTGRPALRLEVSHGAIGDTVDELHCTGPGQAISGISKGLAIVRCARSRPINTSSSSSL